MQSHCLVQNQSKCNQGSWRFVGAHITSGDSQATYVQMVNAVHVKRDLKSKE